MNMRDMIVAALPGEYVRSVHEDLQGTVHEVSYEVKNYIDLSRELVTNQYITRDEAGRNTVSGSPIFKKCNIYLPNGYNENDTNIKYNVLYLLHGVGGNEYEWLSSNGKADGRYTICNIFDNLIANGDIDPTIIVFPNGRSAHDWTDCSFNSEGTNMLGFYYFDYELRYDLIPFIESNYNTYANISDTSAEAVQYNRKHRAIAGLSMGGMQALNLMVGGFRHDSIRYTGTESFWNNGLDKTVLAPGMIDLFAYVGAFSNAPTSSEGKVLGESIASSDYKLPLLYITCGESDGVATGSYAKSIDGLIDHVGNQLSHFYQVMMKNANHDFNVWNNGAYNFSRLIFKDSEEYEESKIFQIEL